MRRWPLVVAAAALVAGGVTYAVTRPDRPAPRARPTADAWRLATLRTPTHLAVAGVSDTAVVLDLDSGHTRGLPIPGPWIGATRAVGALPDAGWLVFASEPCKQTCPEDALYAVRGVAATFVGRGRHAAFDPVRGTVWIGREARNFGGLRQQTMRGELVPLYAVMWADEYLVGVTSRGPVLTNERGGSRARVALVDGGSGQRIVLSKGHALTANGDVVVSTAPACGPSACPIVATNIKTMGSDVVASLRMPPVAAALDPTGRRLAVATADATIVVDVTTGATTTVGGLGTPAPESLAWSPDGTWLVAARPVTRDGVFRGHAVAVWRSGMPAALRAPDYPGAAGDELAVTYAR